MRQLSTVSFALLFTVGCATDTKTHIEINPPRKLSFKVITSNGGGRASFELKSLRLVPDETGAPSYAFIHTWNVDGEAPYVWEASDGGDVHGFPARPAKLVDERTFGFPHSLGWGQCYEIEIRPLKRGASGAYFPEEQRKPDSPIYAKFRIDLTQDATCVGFDWDNKTLKIGEHAGLPYVPGIFPDLN